MWNIFLKNAKTVLASIVLILMCLADVRPLNPAYSYYQMTEWGLKVLRHWTLHQCKIQRRQGAEGQMQSDR